MGDFTPDSRRRRTHHEAGHRLHRPLPPAQHRRLRRHLQEEVEEGARGSREPTRVADPWPADTDPWPADTSKDGCDVVYDDVWEEKCTTVYNDTKCHDEKDRSCEWVPHKVCKTKYKKKCKLVLAHKCHSFKIPKCKFAVEKKCQNKKKCKKVWEKKCEPHHKDVWEKVCKDVKIRVVPDAVKYDYPEEHSSPLTY